MTGFFNSSSVRRHTRSPSAFTDGAPMRAEDLEANRQAWNNKTPYHVRSAFYDVDGFVAGATSLNAYELELLGNVAGKKLLHLQCHFGLDTLSLARMGADVTGLDFSSVATEAARDLAAQTKLEARFVTANVYDAPAATKERYDIVFTSYGALGWLDDMDRWAEAVCDCLAPRGKVVVVEFHPFLWIWNADFSRTAYPWDSHGKRIEEVSTGTYADQSAPLKDRTVGWNHGVGTVAGALAKAGLRMSALREWTRSPYDCFAGAEQTDDGQYIIARFGEGVPLVYGTVFERRL